MVQVEYALGFGTRPVSKTLMMQLMALRWAGV
jgi:hypothetical protein